MTDEPAPPREVGDQPTGTADPSAPPGERSDLLSIVLLVFFVALLLTVAGLLALPLVFD